MHNGLQHILRLEGLGVSYGGVQAVHDVTFVWIKGHNNHAENERCDALAVAQSRKFLTE